MIVKTRGFNYKGQATAEHEGKNLLVWNALPAEEVEVNIIKKKGSSYHSVATKILKPSIFRIDPVEDSYLSTSPWQIIEPDKEQDFKKRIYLDLAKENKIKAPGNLEIYTDNKLYGYRNKMEFSFVEKEDGTISLAFFQREGKKKIAVEGSMLAEAVINKTAKSILSWIKEQKIPIRSLKSLIVRSNGQEDCIAGLFLKDEMKFRSLPSLTREFVGFQIFYSTHKSPASVPTKLLFSIGKNELETVIDSMRFKFGLFSFFQNNISVFSEALKDISENVGTNSLIVDFYSGVGTISLSLKDRIKNAILVESNKEALEFAKINISRNGAKDFEAVLAESENAIDFIEKGRTIIFDPPRTGLHSKIIERLLTVKPERIIYLSCGPETQIRDFNMLKQHYNIAFNRLYNFFPRTPHFESLMVLKLKS